MTTNSLYYFFESHYRSIILFLTVGLIAAIVNFASFTFFYKIIGLNYQLAVAIAYLIALIVHFTANRNITFKKYGTPVTKQIVKYLTIVALNFCITLLITHFSVEFLHLSPFIGLALAIASTTGTGYLFSRFWIFKLLPS